MELSSSSIWLNICNGIVLVDELENIEKIF
jgi:hypothetical protein